MSSGLSWVAVTAGVNRPPQCLYTPHPLVFLKAAECTASSLPSSTSYYTVISFSMLNHLGMVCHDSTATIYRFLSMTIEADQHDRGDLHSSAACWHQCCKKRSLWRKAFRMKPSLSPTAVFVTVFFPSEALYRLALWIYVPLDNSVHQQSSF